MWHRLCVTLILLHFHQQVEIINTGDQLMSPVLGSTLILSLIQLTIALPLTAPPYIHILIFSNQAYNYICVNISNGICQWGAYYILRGRTYLISLCGETLPGSVACTTAAGEVSEVQCYCQQTLVAHWSVDMLRQTHELLPLRQDSCALRHSLL